MTLGNPRIVAMGLLVGACAMPVEGSDGTGASRDAILGGEASGAEDDMVVQIYTSFSVCSGVLIAPNVVATALHCVAPHDPTLPYECTSEGKLAPPDLGGGWIGEPYPASDVFVFYGANGESDALRATEVIGTGSTTVCKDDIAFVVLLDDAPFPGLPVRFHRPIREGEKVTVVGYGGSDEVPEILRARRTGVEVLEVGPDDTTNGYGTVAPRAFVVGEGPCTGDDGGPAISEDTGAVVGTFSRVSSGNACEPGGTNQFTKLAPYRELVERAFASAGREPDVEPPSPSASTRGSGATCAVAFAGGTRSAPHLSWTVVVGLLGVRVGSRARRARARTVAGS
jgi:hypothetical protein